MSGRANTLFGKDGAFCRGHPEKSFVVPWKEGLLFKICKNECDINENFGWQNFEFNTGFVQIAMHGQPFYTKLAKRPLHFSGKTDKINLLPTKRSGRKYEHQTDD